MKVVFIRKDTTKGGKEKWNVKDENDKWYTCWSATVAAQLQDAHDKDYEIDATIKAPTDPKYNDNIMAVLPPGAADAARSLETEEDVLAAFRDEPAPAAPTPAPASPGMTKPAVSELEMLVEERKFAIHMATLAFAGGQIDKKSLPDYADYVLGYVQKNPQVEHKNSSVTKEDTNDVDQFIKR